MEVSFSHDLFDVDIKNIVPTPIVDGEGYKVQCELGQCGMKYFIEKNK